MVFFVETVTKLHFSAFDITRTKRQFTPTCSDGTIAVSNCVNNVCALGLRCDYTRNLCCLQTSGTMPLCPDGSSAVAGCMAGGACGPGYTCRNSYTSTNLCCRVASSYCTKKSALCNSWINNDFFAACPNNAPTSGSCTAYGICSSPTFTCVNNVCCYLANTGIVTSVVVGCPLGTRDIGPCGISPCVIGTCYSTRCCLASPTLTCPDGSAPAGACVNGQCYTTGYLCTSAGMCCSSNYNASGMFWHTFILWVNKFVLQIFG